MAGKPRSRKRALERAGAECVEAERAKLAEHRRTERERAKRARAELAHAKREREQLERAAEGWPTLPIASEADPGPLDYLRDGLTLARRAGMPWHEAYPVACDTALAAAKDDAQREEWLLVLHDTRTEWMRAYERRPTGIALSADTLDTDSNDARSALVLPLQA